MLHDSQFAMALNLEMPLQPPTDHGETTQLKKLWLEGRDGKRQRQTVKSTTVKEPLDLTKNLVTRRWDRIEDELQPLSNQNCVTVSHEVYNLAKVTVFSHSGRTFINEAEITGLLRTELLPYVLHVLGRSDWDLLDGYGAKFRTDIVFHDDQGELKFILEVKPMWYINYKTEYNFPDRQALDPSYQQSSLFFEARPSGQPALPPIDECRFNWWKSIAQLYSEMNQIKAKYAILSTYNCWWFLCRSSNEGELKISKAYGCSTTHSPHDATVMQIIGRLCKTTSIPGGKDALMEPDTNWIAARNDRNKRQVAKPSTSEEPSRKKAKSSEISSSTLMDAVHQVIRSPNREIIDVCSYRASLVERIRAEREDQADQIIKTVAFDRCIDDDEILPELRFEASVYRRLSSLQGECVSVCLGNQVFTVDDIKAVLILSYEGPALHTMSTTSSLVDTIPSAAKEQALQDLSRIHSLGVVHGDLKLPNLVWNSAKQRIVFIDFGCSYVFTEDNDADTWAKYTAVESECLKRLLFTNNEDVIPKDTDMNGADVIVNNKVIASGTVGMNGVCFTNGN